MLRLGCNLDKLEINMSGNGDVHIVSGLGDIINPDNVKPGVDLKELEKKMISGGIIKQKTKDPQDRFNEELQNFAKELGISFGEFSSKGRGSSSNSQPRPTPARPETPPQSPPQERKKDSPFSRSSMYGGGSGGSTFSVGGGSSSYSRSDNNHNDDRGDDKDDRDGGNDDDRDGGHDDDHGDYHPSTGGGSSSGASMSSSRFNNLSSSFGGSGNSELRTRTLEQERRDHINVVLGSDDSLSFSLEKEKLEDQKSSMLAEIDSLLQSLAEENVDVSRIPSVSQSSPYEQVESVLRMLRHKNDHIRYSSFFEEAMLFGAYGLEELFDGKRMWFGRWRLNAVGWHNNLNVKLRRMRHDTGKLVSGVMQDYNIGEGARIVAELLPNFLIYTKMKAQQASQPDMFTDEEMAQANARLAGVN
jgi:hypothetical protein